VVKEDALEGGLELGDPPSPRLQKIVDRDFRLNATACVGGPGEQVQSRDVGDELVGLGSPAEVSRVEIVENAQEVQAEGDGLECSAIDDVDLDA
jgi:hypothetical protein